MSTTKKTAAPNKKLFGTVRSRKKNAKANTQRYLPFAEIRNDVVILKNGGIRAVVQIEPINFNLKSETEQISIIAGYESFINTLVFPLQVLIRSTKVDIDPYIELINASAAQQQNELLRDQTQNYANFITKIVDLADIMAKRFYIVVPLDESIKKQNPINRFMEWMNTDDSTTKMGQRRSKISAQEKRLKERVDLVDTGLRAIGLVPKRLKTMELISLYYEIYNRKQSQSQKITPDTELKTAAGVL